MDAFVTTKRIYIKTGILSTTELDSALDKVVSAGVRQSFFGKLFDYGKVYVTNNGQETSWFLTASPQKVKTIIFDAQEKYKEEQMQKQAVMMANSRKA